MFGGFLFGWLVVFCFVSVSFGVSPFLKVNSWGIWPWRDVSAGKITGGSSKGPSFNSQQPRGDSQLSVILVSGALTHSHSHMCRQNTNVHKINSIFKKITHRVSKMAQ